MVEISKLFGNMWPIVIVVLIILACIAVAVLIAVLVNANKTIKEANKTVEKLNVMADEVNEQITPALKKVDPLIEQANLTVETVNLELLRLDGILEDVQNVTGIAGKAANTVDSVTSAPVKAVAGAAERVRNIFGDSRKKKQTKKLVYPAGTSLVNEAALENEFNTGANNAGASAESAKAATSTGASSTGAANTAEANAAAQKTAAKASSADSASATNVSANTADINSDVDQAATLEELAAMLRAQENAAAEQEAQQGKHYVGKHQKTQGASDAVQGNSTTNVDLQAEEIIQKLSERR